MRQCRVLLPRTTLGLLFLAGLLGAAPGAASPQLRRLLATDAEAGGGAEGGLFSGSGGGNSSSASSSGRSAVVERHGALKTVGNQVVGANGESVVLSGMSLFWSQWSSRFWNEDVVNWLVADWNISIIRCAMGIEMGGYLEDPENQTLWVETVVDAAVKAGIYVIIDWHDHNANEHEKEAGKFFAKMAKKYGKEDALIFETFNEPMQQNWTTEVKPYHEAVLKIIREHSSNLVILGTTTWSQDADLAADDPVDDPNVAYTLHFYAATHGEDLRKKALKAMKKGVALAVTEWGTCDATGNGTLDFDASAEWLTFLKKNNISDMGNWAIGDKYESCAALKPGANDTGHWGTTVDDELTYSGAWMRSYLTGQGFDAVECDAPGWPCVKPKCAASNAVCKDRKCCQDEAESCFAKDVGWAQCMKTCGEAEDQADWSCEVLTNEKPPSPVEHGLPVWVYIAVSVGVGVLGAIVGAVCFTLLCGRVSASAYQRVA